MDNSIVLIYLIINCFGLSKTSESTVQVVSSFSNKQSLQTKINVEVEDIIRKLRERKWDTKDIICLNKTIDLISGLNNNTLWSTWAWESMNPAPLGQLFGSRHHLGNYDECMLPIWSEEHPDLQTQYCLIDVKLEDRHGMIELNRNSIEPYDTVFDYLHYQEHYGRLKDRLLWGICIPASCHINATLTIADVLLKRSHLYSPNIRMNITVDSCQRPGEIIEYDLPHNIFVAFVTFLVAIALVCTYINLRTAANSDTMATHIIRSFCIIENTKKLDQYSSDGLEALFGVRFFSIVFIVMGHQIMYYNIGPISDGIKADRMLSAPTSLLIIHDDLFVDTFFMLSGLLVMRALMFINRMPNIIAVILKRYIRLAPALAVCIFYMSTALKYSGDGPLWPRYVREDSEPCQQNWWLNLLMLNNFVDTNNMCYVNTWYIPCDFQLFLLGVFLFWIYSTNKTVGIVVFVTTAVISLVVPAAVTEYYGLPALPIMAFEVLLNSRTNRHFNIYYIKFYNRAAVYLVGLATGYIISKHNPKDQYNRISDKKATILSLCGIVILLSDLLYGAYIHQNGWGHIEGILFAILTRPVWGVGLAFVIIACAYGYVPLLSPLLTWYPWIPLSKLSFGVYLTHGLLMYRNIYVTRNLNHSDTGNMAVDTLGVLMWSLLLAYIIWILVEAPINNLYTIIFVPRNLLLKVYKREITHSDLEQVFTGGKKTKKEVTQELKCEIGKA